MKNQEKFLELLKYCNENKGDAYTLKFEGNIGILTGISKVPLKPVSALVVMKEQEDTIIVGRLDGINLTDDEEYNSADITLAVDVRNNKKVKVYYSIGESVNKINSKSYLDLENMMMVYWEIQESACLTLVCYDPIRKGTVVEIIESEDEGTKNCFRGMVRNYLFQYNPSLINSFENETVTVGEEQ